MQHCHYHTKCFIRLWIYFMLWHDRHSIVFSDYNISNARWKLYQYNFQIVYFYIIHKGKNTMERDGNIRKDWYGNIIQKLFWYWWGTLENWGKTPQKTIQMMLRVATHYWKHIVGTSFTIREENTHKIFKTTTGQTKYKAGKFRKNNIGNMFLFGL